MPITRKVSAVYNLLVNYFNRVGANLYEGGDKCRRREGKLFDINNRETFLYQGILVGVSSRVFERRHDEGRILVALLSEGRDVSGLASKISKRFPGLESHVFSSSH